MGNVVTALECAECGRALGHNAVICRDCVDGLAEQLLMVPALIGELTVTRAGLGRSGPAAAGGRPAETPLPIRMRGKSFPGQSAVRRLETSVIGWARIIAEDLGVIPAVGIASLVQLTQDHRRLPGSAVRPDGSALAEPVTAVEQAAVWLAQHRQQIARHEAAAELAGDVRAAVTQLAAVIWPTPRQYLGLCDTKNADTLEVCGQELRAEAGATYVRCRRCRWQHDVATLKREALGTAENRLYKLDDIRRILDQLGHPVPRPTLYRWAANRRIESHGWEHRDGYGTRITDHRIQRGDAQVYRLGDALKLAVRGELEGGSAA